MAAASWLALENINNQRSIMKAAISWRHGKALKSQRKLMKAAAFYLGRKWRRIIGSKAMAA
jgi:hypothetical protein